MPQQPRSVSRAMSPRREHLPGGANHAIATTGVTGAVPDALCSRARPGSHAGWKTGGGVGIRHSFSHPASAATLARSRWQRPDSRPGRGERRRADREPLRQIQENSRLQGGVIVHLAGQSAGATRVGKKQDLTLRSRESNGSGTPSAWKR